VADPAILDLCADEIHTSDLLSDGALVVKLSLGTQNVVVTVAIPGREYERSLVHDPGTIEAEYELSDRVFASLDIVRVLRRPSKGRGTHALQS
jgi:hypothetical protein